MEVRSRPTRRSGIDAGLLPLAERHRTARLFAGEHEQRRAPAGFDRDLQDGAVRMTRGGTPSRGIRPLRSMWLAAEGIAVVEFAFVAAFLVTLYLGRMQLADAIFANRKITTTARAITDLTTQ